MSINKIEIRKEMSKKRALIPSAVKKEMDESFNAYLIRKLVEMEVKNLHIYLPIKSEIDWWPTINKALDLGIQVICPEAVQGGILKNWPLSREKKLKKGIFGTFYPDHLSTYEGPLDLIIVPGLAFDKNGGRLGYGGGYYDRFLKKYRSTMTMAFCYNFQILEELPLEKHDIRIKNVVTLNKTERKIIEFSFDN